MKIRINILSIVLSLLALAGINTPALAETTNCTAITYLPYTISSQGVYCLTGNLSTSQTVGTAIVINTNNVTLDLNGFKLGGLAAGIGTEAHGIYAGQRKNITIKNGIVRGFLIGIWLSDISPYTTSQGNLIEDIRADQNTWMAIQVQGRGNMIRRNQVVDTGGSTVVSQAYGISAVGPGTKVIDNDISTTWDSSRARAIYVAAADGAVVRGNRIDNTVITGSTSGGASATGIYLENSDGTLVRDNHVSNSAITSDTFGVYLWGTADQAVVVDNSVANMATCFKFDNTNQFYRRNTANNCTTAYTGGTAGTQNESN